MVLIAVLGAGAMGGSAARLLARHDDVDLVVVDADGRRAEAVVGAVGRGEARASDAAAGGLAGALGGADAVACCLPYRLNLEAMEAALAARVPYADLGGLFHMTLRQLELDARFREAGLPAVVGIGACPGLSNLMAALAAERLDDVRSIDIIDGAVEESASGFGVPYSAETILDEYTMPAYVFEEGELREVPAASGEVRYAFPPPSARCRPSIPSTPSWPPFRGRSPASGTSGGDWPFPPRCTKGSGCSWRPAWPRRSRWPCPTARGSVPVTRSSPSWRASRGPRGRPGTSRCWTSWPRGRWAGVRLASWPGARSVLSRRASARGPSGRPSPSPPPPGGWPADGASPGSVLPRRRSRPGSSWMRSPRRGSR
ncbi:MAG: saccharopine dehydrogenase NADP-binding domain-containing protein [Actinobacteria bacterium]|nr:saccharopine dehydrogenase NADP-binding domain-containing protein [Actinomycetota bacterium]